MRKTFLTYVPMFIHRLHWINRRNAEGGCKMFSFNYGLTLGHQKHFRLNSDEDNPPILNCSAVSWVIRTAELNRTHKMSMIFATNRRLNATKHTGHKANSV